MLADELDHVIGVDTHRDQHVLAVIVVPTGAVIAQRSLPTTTHGYAAALRFADEFAPGRRLWAIEGAGHYGAGLARYLTARNEMVHESARSTRAERRSAVRTIPSTRPAPRARRSGPALAPLPARESVRRRCGY